MNTDKDLYFTWYLKTDGCPETSSNLSDEKKKKCDLDGDSDIDINDYKIKAARIISSNDFEWNKSGSYSSHTDRDGYKAYWGGDDQKGKNNYCYVHDTNSGDEFPIECDNHLFAEMKDSSSHTTGDGSFDSDEEEFWHTDPNDPDTADTGNSDEANISGLGISGFSWTYTEGDEVGVVVEGVSIEPTSKADSSYKIMFALLKNTCSLDYDNDYPITTEVSRTVTEDDPEEGQTTTVIVTNKEEIYQQAGENAEVMTTPTTQTIITNSETGAVISDTSVTGTVTSVFKDISDNYSISNVSAVTDLNKCLTKNLITPSEGGGAKEKMDVQLSYSPEAPMNDPVSGSREGDKIRLTSSVSNASNSNYLSYNWQIYKSDEANPDDWGDPLSKDALTDSTQTSGIGADNLSFRLNFDDDNQFYLKVKLTVKENISKRTVREGNNYVVIPVSSSTDKIKIYRASVSNSSGNPYISMDSTELCDSGVDKTVCPVVKDQIIGVKVPAGLSDFSWTINGRPFNYTSCFFEGCSLSKQTNVAFFPILEEPGGQYTVTLTATNITTGKKINLARYFQVIEPKINIISADETKCKPNLLGYYVDYNGKKWPDYSRDNFKAVAGYEIKISADFTGFIPEGEDWTWIVNGQAINIYNASDSGYEITDDNEIILTAPDVGQSVDVGISALYHPNTATKQALKAFWGVNYSGLYEVQVG
ncbi:MAG TPA: hypothetical protein VK255_02635, partial [Patescibacteria group bacterium]|nr:hypothetical protein [Patescibacteria group bacterium]